MKSFFFLSYEMILEFSENWSETVLEFGNLLKNFY